jgi:hypothetical protein
MWAIEAKIPGDEQNAKLKFTKSGDDYTGVLIDDEGDEYKLESVTLEGDLLSFSFTLNEQGMSMEMVGSAKISDDSLEGTISVGEFGSFPLEGNKISNPEKY